MTTEMQDLKERASNEQNNRPAESYGMDFGVLPPANNSREVTSEDVLVVQCLIENCLQLYMKKNEAADILLHIAGIEPKFTNLVWDRLEEENKEYFRIYSLRLVLRKQIKAFNHLLEQQCRLMKLYHSSGVSSAAIQNGTQHMPVDNVHLRYTNPQQHLMPSEVQPHMDLTGCVPNSQMANGISVHENFHPAQVHSGMVMTCSTVDTITIAPLLKSEVDFRHASGASDGQYDFAPTEPSASSIDTTTLDSTFASHLATPESLHLGPDPGSINFYDFSQLGALNFDFPHPATESMNLEVEDFIADGAQDSQIEEKSS